MWKSMIFSYISTIRLHWIWYSSCSPVSVSTIWMRISMHSSSFIIADFIKRWWKQIVHLNNTHSSCKFFVCEFEFISCFLIINYFYRMWAEIKSKAKMELLHVLFMNSVSLTKGVTTLGSNERPKPKRHLIERLRNVILAFELYHFF